MIKFLENDNMASRIVVLTLGWKQKDFVVHIKNTCIGLTARLDTIYICLREIIPWARTKLKQIDYVES